MLGRVVLGATEGTPRIPLSGFLIVGSQPVGVVRGGHEVRFHEGSTRVPRGFHEVLRGLRGGASTKKSTECCWGRHLSLFCQVGDHICGI